MAESQQRDNSGALFLNDRKTEENHPDSKGSITVNGVEYWISAWRKTARSGQKFLSLAVNPKQPNYQGSGQQTQNGYQGQGGQQQGQQPTQSQYQVTQGQGGPDQGGAAVQQQPQQGWQQQGQQPQQQQNVSQGFVADDESTPF